MLPEPRASAPVAESGFGEAGEFVLGEAGGRSSALAWVRIGSGVSA